MIRTLIISTCLALGAAGVAWEVAVGSPERASPIQEQIGDLVWERQLGPAVEKAKRQGKPLLVVFRCPP